MIEKKLAVTIVGTGYVGLTTGVSLAWLGHKVTCVDNNEAIINKLKKGIPTIYENGLESLLKEVLPSMNFANTASESLNDAQVVIIAVGTPAKANGDTDLSFVEEVAREIGRNMLPEKNLVVVNKSTVPIGTAKRVYTVINEELDKRNVKCCFSVASNPEFLREGAALHDTFYPDRIVVGAEEVDAVNILRQMYAPILEQNFTPPRSVPRPEGYYLPAFVTTSPTSAELIKYAANSFLAMKISFVNEFSGIAERVGADIREVAKGIGLDKRIGGGFLNAGVGWGGSCFPKDTRSILFTGGQYGFDMPLISAAVEVNRRQRNMIIEKLQSNLKVIRGSSIGILGLSFKANTDDIRESPAIDIIAELLEMGASVKVYDPVAMNNYRTSFPEQQITCCNSTEECAKDTDALVLLTEWEAFLHIPWGNIAKIMRKNIIIDGRNFLKQHDIEEAGFTYKGVGF